MSSGMHSTPASLYVQAGLDYLTLWLQSFFVAPITGGPLAYMSHTLWPFNLLLIAGGAFLFIRLCRGAHKNVQLFVASIALGSLLFATASVVGRLGLYGQSAGDTAFASLSRHNSIYAWLMALSWAPIIRWKQLTSLLIGRIILALQVSVLLCMWFIRISPPKVKWSHSVATLRAFAHAPTGSSEEISIPTFHSGYSEVSCRKAGEELTCLGTWSQRQHLFTVPIAALNAPL